MQRAATKLLGIGMVVCGSLVAAGPAVAQAPTHDCFTASDDVRIHYMTLGDEGSWVVLIHGYMDSAERMWFRTGIAEALASNHRVVALDNRNHGQSDHPEPNGPGRPEDVLELMGHLGIERAHIHGYSMGGVITSRLLASDPGLFITAGLGGSGLSETDPDLRELAESMDPEAPEPEGLSVLVLRLSDTRGSSDASQRENDRPRGVEVGVALEFDVRAHAVPVIAINGEWDSPYSKTLRIFREFEVFQNVVLPGRNHVNAIMGGVPRRYIDSMVAFIDGYDVK